MAFIFPAERNTLEDEFHMVLTYWMKSASPKFTALLAIQNLIQVRYEGIIPIYPLQGQLQSSTGAFLKFFLFWFGFLGGRRHIDLHP